MLCRKLSALAAAAVIAAAFIAVPDSADARGRGGGFRGGGFHAGGFHGGGRIGVARVGGFHTAGFSRRAVFVGRPFIARRAFIRTYPRYAVYPGYSCWRWVPTVYGLQRIWVCGPYYGYYGYGYY